MRGIAIVLMVLNLFLNSCQASPLDNFSQGKTAVDINCKLYNFEGTGGHEFSWSTGLGNNWAVNYRQTGYDAAPGAIDMRVKNQEFNILHKCQDNIQVYAGYSATQGLCQGGHSGRTAKNVMQLGAIVEKKISNRTVLYAIVGGGQNVTNVEIGVSYLLRPGWELNATYRHFTVEKVGVDKCKENYRGFGLGITYKF